MPDGFVVDTGQLRKHSAATEAIGGRAGVAADAGSQVADMDQAYGLLCMPIGAMLKGPQERCAEAIKASAESLHQASKKLDEAAKSYDETEQRTVTALEQILKKLEEMRPVTVGNGGH